MREKSAGVRIAIFLLLLGVPPLLLAEDQSPANNQALILENFDEDPPLTFPARWKVRGDEDVAKAVYRVAEEAGNHFLHAYADNQDVQIGLTRTFKPKEFPVLQWRWRVKQLPKGGDERTVKTNDSAAGVYVVFDSALIPRVIKYVWSSTLPVGTSMQSPVYWRAKVVVLESGSSRSDEWEQETINVYEDYKKLFGAEPGEVQGIAVLTDSNTTKSVAEADYDDFTLFAAGTASAEETKKTTSQLDPAVVDGSK